MHGRRSLENGPRVDMSIMQLAWAQFLATTPVCYTGLARVELLGLKPTR